MNIKWQRNNFIRLFAKMKIRVGSKDNKIDSIQEGDEFEYDGSILKYGGQEIQTTSLRGAVANDWASDVEGDDMRVAPVVPTRNAAKAVSINKNLNKVQRGSIIDSSGEQDEETILEVSDRGKTEQTAGAARGASPNILRQEHNRKQLAIQVSDVDSQESVIVGRVRSAPKIKVDVSTKPNMATEIENRGLGRPVFNKNARETTVETEGVTIKTNVSNIDRTAKIFESDDDSGGTIVAKVRHSKPVSTEGISVKDTSNIRSGSKPKGKPEKSREPIADSDLPMRIRIARTIDPNFPADWSFSGKLADRMEAIKAHGVSPQFLNALYAAEGDQMRKKLESEFPKQFK